MKPTGFVRKVDRMGRIDLPTSLRREFGIKAHTPMEYFVEGENIMLIKYEPSCIFCKSTEGLETFKEKNICKNCKSEIAN